MEIKTIVIKIGGSILGQNDTTAEDVVALQRHGYKIIVVHGGAKDINQWLDKFEIQSKFVKGIRSTGAAALNIVTAVLCGLVNKNIVADILRQGGKAVGLSGIDGLMIQAKILTPELGYTGEELRVNTDLIMSLLNNGYILVIAPVSLNIDTDSKYQSKLLNVNGDTVAAEIAVALEANKLIFLTDVPGLYDEKGNIIKSIKSHAAIKMIESDMISGGMAVKIKSCIDAVSRVPTTRIIDGRNSHALIREIEVSQEGTTIEA